MTERRLIDVSSSHKPNLHEFQGFAPDILKKTSPTRIVDQLIRLDSASFGKGTFTPQQKLGVTIDALSIGISAASQMYSCRPTAVERAIRDTKAAIAYLDRKNGISVDGDVLNRVEILKTIGNDLIRLAKKVKSPEIRRTLEQVPHAQKLLSGYLRWRTAKPLLDLVNMKYNEYQLRSVGRFFTADTVDDALDGLTQLARRFVLADWLISGENDQNISQTAAQTLTEDCSQLDGRKPARIQSMKEFLVKIMDKELQLVSGDPSEEPVDISAFFPSHYDSSVRQAAEVYARYGKAGYCPQSLKQYAQLAVQEVPGYDRAQTLGLGPYYSREWLQNLDWAGLKFLENTLAMKNDAFSWSVLTQDTGSVLREAKKKMLDGS